MQGFLPIVVRLINANANLNTFNLENESPLFISVETARFDIFQTLLNAGADPTLKNNLEQNVVVYLLFYGEVDMLKYLASYLGNQKK